MSQSLVSQPIQRVDDVLARATLDLVDAEVDLVALFAQRQQQQMKKKAHQNPNKHSPKIGCLVLVRSALLLRASSSA